MDWQSFVTGKPHKTSGDAIEKANVEAYRLYQYFEGLASRVESIESNGVGAIQFALMGRGLVGPRGNRMWVEQVAPGLWEEVARAGAVPSMLESHLIARAHRLGRI
jgi:hypothetical protein